MDTICQSSDTLAIVASGASINEQVEKFQNKFTTIDTLSMGSSFAYFINTLKLVPNYVTYLDPYASIEIFDLIINNSVKNCTLFICNPIVTKDYATQCKYIGNASGKGLKWTSYYLKYLDRLEQVKKICKVIEIPSTSFRKLYYKEFRKLVDKGGDFLPCKKFLQILRSEAKQNNQLCVMEMWTVGRLTTYLLPLLYFLSFNNIFTYNKILLAGFDGYAPKFYRSKITKREEVLSKIWEKEYRFYMPMWQSLFSELGIEILKITPSPAMESIHEYHL